ncbi:MAG TPA: hypothetical protein VMV83_06020 [Rectinemataceae bacterium]|nr:hypothetical protein [Rectinemataceae bacterium]
MGKAWASRHRWPVVVFAIILAGALTGCDTILGLLGAPSAVITVSPSSPVVGAQVTASASQSSGTKLQYSWTLVTPTGSTTAQLDLTDAETVHFIPDVAGTYSLDLTITNSMGSASAKKSVIVSQNPDYYGVPTNLAASVSGTALTLTWTAATDVIGNAADSYKVFQSSTQTGTYIDITAADSDPTNTTFTKTLNAGQTAWFKVIAVYGTSTSLYSAAVSATATGSTTLTVPTLSVGTVTSSSVALSWNIPTGATGFTVYRASTSGGTGISIFTDTTGSANSYTDSSSLSAGSTYYYSIIATYATGTSAESSQVPVLIPTIIAAPSAPTGLAHSSVTTSSASLTWNSVSGATGYYVYVGGTKVNASPTSYPNFFLSGLSAGQIVTWSVSATNSAGEGSTSSTDSFTTSTGATGSAPATPVISSVVANPANPTSSLNISWSEPLGAISGTTKYAVYRDSSATGSFSTLVGSTFSTSISDINLQSGYTYWYEIKAGNQGTDLNGNPITLWSSLSSAVSGTTTIVTVTNYPPNQPTAITPLNGSSSISISTSLSWSGSDPESDPLTYDLYVGPYGYNTVLQLNLTSSTSWSPPAGFIGYGTTYAWYVIAHDTHGNATAGPTWTFTTVPQTGTPPTVSLWSTTSGSYTQGIQASFSGMVSQTVSPYSNLSNTASWTVYDSNWNTVAWDSASYNATTTYTDMKFTPTAVGLYYVYLAGSDGGITASSSMTINVLASGTGTVTIGVQ